MAQKKASTTRKRSSSSSASKPSASKPKTSRQPAGLPEKGVEGQEWEGGLSTEPSLAGHYLDSGQTEADDHTTRPKA